MIGDRHLQMRKIDLSFEPRLSWNTKMVVLHDLLIRSIRGDSIKSEINNK